VLALPEPQAVVDKEHVPVVQVQQELVLALVQELKVCG
jgi:hypothetical protein